MFGLFRKPFASRIVPGWHGRLGWQVMTYHDGADWLSLQVEPMKDGPCRVCVPGEKAWAAQAPAWAAGQRATVLARLRGIAWNRDLAWIASEATRFWHLPVTTPADGAIESTPAGRRLESRWLFHPDSPARLPRAQAKEAWFEAVEAACLQVRGRVELDPAAVIPGSVSHEIVLPTLRRNPRVVLSFGGATSRPAGRPAAVAARGLRVAG